MGVDGVGEGIVWKCITEGWESPEFYFKVKGEKHSASKVKTLAAVDVELVASQREFAEKTVTENRCRQGIDKLREAGKKLDRTSVGDFIKWVVADVEKEESDTAKASGLDIKKASGELTKAARMWFFKNELTF
jgi:ferritin